VDEGYRALIKLHSDGLRISNYAKITDSEYSSSE
jgi:hypothetical protein